MTNVSLGVIHYTAEQHVLIERLLAAQLSQEFTPPASDLAEVNNRRCAEFDAGRMESYSWEEVRDSVRRKIAQTLIELRIYAACAVSSKKPSIVILLSSTGLLPNDLKQQSTLKLRQSAGNQNGTQSGDDLHRFTLVPGFPHNIAYRAFPSRVEIVAAFHTSRDAAVWSGR